MIESSHRVVEETSVPKYDYRCTACGQVYEKREGFDAPSVQQCPSCQGVARRVLTPPAIVFKGSGWYKTDSRGSEPSAPTAAPSSSDAKPASPTVSTAESKPAAAETAAAD
jgi:putative FmdB family regulatory protein